jgi:glutamyl-tRNA synthetase
VKKLRSFNADYIRALSHDQFVAVCQPWLHSADAPWPSETFDPAAFDRMADHIQTRVEVLADVPPMIDFLFVDVAPAEADWDKVMKAPAADMLAGVIGAYESCPWKAETLKAELEAVGAALGLKPGKAQAPARLAVTGRSVGPPLYESLEVLGRERTLARLRAAHARL